MNIDMKWCLNITCAPTASRGGSSWSVGWSPSSGCCSSSTSLPVRRRGFGGTPAAAGAGAADPGLLAQNTATSQPQPFDIHFCSDQKFLWHTASARAFPTACARQLTGVNKDRRDLLARSLEQRHAWQHDCIMQNISGFVEGQHSIRQSRRRRREHSHRLGGLGRGLQHGGAHGLVVHPVGHRLHQLRQQRRRAMDELAELVHLHSRIHHNFELISHIAAMANAHKA